MEAQTSNLCSGCLAVDRRMLHIQNSRKTQCYLQIIQELAISPPNSTLSLWLCWECEANITRFTKFKLQVKHSYEILHDVTIQNTIPEHITKLCSQQVVSITLSPDSEQNDLFSITTVKTETDNDQKEALQKTPIIKYETDFSDDDEKLLIDISIDNLKTKVKKNSKVKRNGTVKNISTVKKNSKVKRNRKVKVKKKSNYNEIELTEEEIEEERKNMSSRDDYVNAMFRCEMCIMSFPNEDDMKDHTFKKHELHVLGHRCGICSCSFSTEVAYNYHCRRHRRRYECAVCHYRCASAVLVKKHSTAVHFQSAAHDLVHKKIKNDALDENDLKGSKSEDKFPCEFCPKVFSWKTSLRKHVEKHRIETGQKRRPYCEPCRLSFTTTANLQKHVRTSSKHQIQLKLRKLKDSDPDSNDKQIADITTSVNSKREMFPCAQCDRKFQWRGNLLRHLHSHAARANGELVCEPCNRTFSSIATYKQHMKISKKHAVENDFKYMCSDCGKKFANKTKLKDHVDWEHLKNYVHTCTDCQKVFKTHTSLYLHRQVVHKKMNAAHLCENCGKSFPNQTKLRSHKIALHTSESPYKCSVCGARFSWHSCLSRHLRRVHRTNK